MGITIPNSKRLISGKTYSSDINNSSCGDGGLLTLLLAPKKKISIIITITIEIDNIYE